MKKDMKVWAIKLRGRSLYKDPYNIPYLYPTRQNANYYASVIAARENRNPMNRSPSTEVVRVRLRVEEIV